MQTGDRQQMRGPRAAEILDISGGKSPRSPKSSPCPKEDWE